MKKIILAVVLLALVIGVSYVKTFREHDRSNELYEKGLSDGARELDSTERAVDSLKSAMADQQLAFADSLVKKDATHRSRVDSLESVVEQKDKTIKSLTSQTATTQAASIKKAAPKKTLSKHEEILKYYKRRFANLPKDLSEYEKRIAVNEIREETSLKFSITLAELKQIREKYRLTY